MAADTQQRLVADTQQRADRRPDATGLIGGLLSGLLGIGGGTVMVPLLVLWTRRSQRAAHAISLGAIIPISVAAIAVYGGAGQVNIPDALALIVGAVTGMLSGLLGVGGGIFMVPLLVLAVGLSQHAAQATSLVVVLPTAVVASWSLHRRGVGDMRLAARMGLIGMVGSVAGTFLALRLPGHVLRLFFAALMVVVALRLLRDACAAAPERCGTELRITEAEDSNPRRTKGPQLKGGT